MIENTAPVLDTEHGHTVFNYENHYSARLNECFFLEIAVSYEKEKSTSSKVMRLLDLNKNEGYGTFVSGPTESMPVTCVARGKGCQSESEWRQLLETIYGGLNTIRVALLDFIQQGTSKNSSRQVATNLTR